MKTLAAALVLAVAAPALAQGVGAPQPGAATLLPPPPPPPAAPLAPAYGKSEGLIPGWVIGPKLSLVQVPAPGIGLEAKFRNVLGLSLDYELIPTVSLADVSAGYSELSLGAKWYPWRGSFFLGASLGRRSFEASATGTISGIPAKAEVEVASTYLSPELGWRWVWSSGFFMGMDVGYQVILSSDTTLRIPLGIDAETEIDVKDAGDEIGKFGLPIVSLLQVGWFF